MNILDIFTLLLGNIQLFYTLFWWNIRKIITLFATNTLIF